MGEIKGKVIHTKKIQRSDGVEDRLDTLTTSIPFDCIDDEGLGILQYWCIEDFDYAYIDWHNMEIVMVYRTYHGYKVDNDSPEADESDEILF